MTLDEHHLSPIVENMRTINTHCHGITVTLDGQGGGVLKSDLDKDAAMAAIESLVLAHAIAGIDITNPAYLEGLETAIDAAIETAIETHA